MPFLRWKKCLSDPKQLLKLIAVIICICIAMYQLSGCIKKIYNPPVSTHYSFDLNQTLSYPALTICRYPAYKTSVLEKYGMTSNDPKYHTAWRNFNYENYTLNEFFEDATYSFSEILPFYGFDSFDTNIIVESSFLLTHGRCFTLTPKNETTDWFSGGYFLYFTHTDTVRMLSESGVSLSGFNIYIHDRRDLFTGGVENFESLIDYMYIEAGEEMRLNLKIHVYDQLPTAHHKCNNSRTYSQSKCIKECLNKKVTEAIGCSTPWLINDDLKSCNSYPEMYTIIKNQTSLSTQFVNQCDCPLPCYLTVYTPYIQNRKDIALPYSQMSITFSSNLITSMTEVIGYDWNIFLSDLGGSLGFLLGLSVLGAIAALEQIVQAVMTKKNGNENIRKEENNVKEQNNYKSDVQISLNDKKLIEEIMGIRQSSKRIEYFLDSNFYDSHKDKDNFIQNKY